MSRHTPIVFTEAGLVYRERYHRFIADFETPGVIVEATEWLESLLGRIPVEPEIARHPSDESLGDWGPSATTLAYHAPVALIEGAWLQQVNQPATSHLPAVATLFKGYLTLLGSDAGDSPAHAYRGLLARHGLAMPETTTSGFALHPQAGDLAFAWGALELALALGGTGRFELLLGYSAAYAGSFSPWRMAGVSEPGRSSRLRRFADIVTAAWNFHLEVDGKRAEVQDRRRQGLALYRLADAEYLGALVEVAGLGGPDLPAQVAKIFAAKAPFAAGYHGKKRLAGCPLNDWFAGRPFDSEGFLAAFADSSWIEGEPGSRPFDRLTGFGGPMFGVFSAQELATIHRWISAGRPLGRAEPFAFAERGSPIPIALQPSKAWSPVDLRTRDKGRELFYRLVNSATDGATMDAARLVVERELKRARRSFFLHRTQSLRFFDYSPLALNGWVQQLHREAVERYRPLKATPRLRKAEYVWAIRQFAPAVLVDGGWLAGISLAAHQDDPVFRYLLTIYADELGAGEPARHHPAIYRGLLETLKVDVPPLKAAEFSASEEFLDAAFDLPVYCLSIGRMPNRYLPEILGLNLAIELSGLGAGYLRLGEELDYWGIDPLIVRLHQSIDNLACGHAALAVEAIQGHLDDVGTAVGQDGVAICWRRIWTGYLSLHTSTRRLKRALAMEFCKKFWRTRLSDFLTRLWRQKHDLLHF